MSFFDMVKEYFGWTNLREPEGWFSAAHLIYVTLMIGVTVFLAVWLGLRLKDKDLRSKTKVLKVAAILMISFELLKIVIFCIQDHSISTVRSNLPLWLCSITLFSMPIAAFGKGRAREGASDFTFCFGMLCALAGTYLAGNYFGGSPVLSFSVNVSVTTHCISGFSALFIGVAGLWSLKKKNLWFSYAILGGFEALALLTDCVNKPYQSNYMFFRESDGTPFSIVESIVRGNQIGYTVFVMALYFIYLTLYIGIALLCRRAAENRRAAATAT